MKSPHCCCRKCVPLNSCFVFTFIFSSAVVHRVVIKGNYNAAMNFKLFYGS